MMIDYFGITTGLIDDCQGCRQVKAMEPSPAKDLLMENGKYSHALSIYKQTIGEWTVSTVQFPHFSNMCETWVFHATDPRKLAHRWHDWRSKDYCERFSKRLARFMIRRSQITGEG